MTPAQLDALLRVHNGDSAKPAGTGNDLVALARMAG